MNVREIALQNFGEASIPMGRPMAMLEDALVPIYLFHRYQIEGTVKLIGGMDYSYKLRGDMQSGPEPVPAGQQRAALDAMLSTISVEALRMPENIVDIIPPRPIGYYGSRELFNSHTDPAFDPLGAAETAAHATTSLLFNANRAARLVDFEAQNSELLGLAEMIDKIIENTWKAEPLDGYDGAIQRAVNFVTLYNMIQLAANDDASSQVRAISNEKLLELYDFLNNEEKATESEQWLAAYNYGAKLIDGFMENPERIEEMTPPLSPPPGSPIGSGDAFLGCEF